MNSTEDILDWAYSRGIIGPEGSGTPRGQLKKTYEELSELLMAVLDNDKEEIKDGIGDVYVTLVIQAAMHGLSMEECVEQAYNQIKNRTGKMVGGVFVKDQE